MRTSESITNISAALAAFQGDVTNPKHSARADVPTRTGGKYSYSYTPLQDIINHIRPALAKHKLAVIQSPRSEDGSSITVTTLLVHESGEWIEADELTMKAEKVTAQGAGSIITYARRYALSAVLGLATEDDDDAGSQESARPVAKQQKPKPKQPQPPKADKPSQPKPKAKEGMISEAQRKRLFTLAKGSNDIVRKVLAEYEIASTGEVPELLYTDICDKVRLLAIEQEVTQ